MAKIKFLLLSLLIMSLTACVKPINKIDFSPQMNGFRDYKWGTSIEDTKNILISRGIDKNRNVEWFTKKNDPLHIGKANLENIDYVFRDGRLTAVSITAHGLSNSKALREALEKNLGKIQPSENENLISWDLAHTSIFFSYNEQSETAMMIINAK